MDTKYYRKVFQEIVGSVDQILQYRQDWQQKFSENHIDCVTVESPTNWIEIISDILASINRNWNCCTQIKFLRSDNEFDEFPIEHGQVQENNPEGPAESHGAKGDTKVKQVSQK